MTQETVPHWPAPIEAVLPLVGPYIARQRWARHDNAEGPVGIERADLLFEGPPMALWLVVRSGSDLYQLVIGLRSAETSLDLGERDILGRVEVSGSSYVAYDGLADAEIVKPLARSMGVSGIEDAIVRPVGAEQSNSSVVLGQKVILKVFRRLQSGTNPDVEVSTGLDQVGFNHLASPLGVWSRDGFDLAVAQEFLAGGSEGWALALTSLRDLYASDEEDPAAAGGDFGAEARRIGEMTARMHIALAEAFGLHPPALEDWAGALSARADRLGIEAGRRRQVEELAGRLRSLGGLIPSIRVHGDYHLGQVMRADAGWFVLDFEGEPARPIEERRLPWPAAKDVAGMLRSFDYAAAVALAERAESEGDLLRARGRSWEQRSRAAFLEGYGAVEGVARVLPAGASGPAAGQDLLDFFELDKALYELEYERAHRPDWERIPQSAIERLLGG